MDRFERIDNPEANEQRAKIISGEIKTEWCRYSGNYQLNRAKQEQEVIDKRKLLEEFAQMLEDYKAKGEELEEFAREHDLPGINFWEGVESWMHGDVIGTALQWAHSNHSC